jgi:predicted lysophospholipase L1 biosynthesis ABC-type transport system permease subunit
MKKIWVLQFVANALIVFAFYEWLGIRDSRASQLILSFGLGLAIIAGTVFLHSQTFHMRPLRFAAILLIFLLVLWGLNQLPLAKIGLWMASTLTFKSRKPVKPDSVVSTLTWLKLLIQWIVVPLLLLQRRSPRFWLQYIAVVLVAFLVPSLLIHWTPKLTSTALQVTSFILRFGVAYCLIITGFVALWRFTASGNPVESQPTTVVLP